MYTNPLYGIQHPDNFCKWISKFSNKTAYVCTKSDCVKYAINKTLAELTSIKIKTKDVNILELNILRACYLASEAEMPEKDWRAQNRNELKSFMDSLPIALQNIYLLLNFISSNKSFSAKAFAVTGSDNSKKTNTESPSDYKKLKDLEHLLVDYESGLMDFSSDHDHVALISSSDFIYGPFEFNYDLNSEWKSKGTKSSDMGKNIIEAGLMFHLAYLFRYFTMDSPPVIPGQVFFDKDEILLIDSVKMLKDGKPHFHLIANFTNAVFATKYSSRDIKDKLDSLLKTHSKSAPDLKIIPPVFIGWC